MSSYGHRFPIALQVLWRRSPQIPYCSFAFAAQENSGSWSLQEPPFPPATHSSNMRYDWRAATPSACKLKAKRPRKSLSLEKKLEIVKLQEGAGANFIVPMHCLPCHQTNSKCEESRFMSSITHSLYLFFGLPTSHWSPTLISSTLLNTPLSALLTCPSHLNLLFFSSVERSSLLPHYWISHLATSLLPHISASCGHSYVNS
ncbi:hypothetical protein E2C01_037862 [Portunus trituberculatus]|uniref:Uncharacterized protein n=1 Tax=Portunus trituberculatus TaxID=210409 RepID=A0A5B7FF68_PORTR|nr:hypothetical protein [Portunus trituberculatus]